MRRTRSQSLGSDYSVEGEFTSSIDGFGDFFPKVQGCSQLQTYAGAAVQLRDRRHTSAWRRTFTEILQKSLQQPCQRLRTEIHLSSVYQSNNE
jgi:hypothetical protein